MDDFKYQITIKLIDNLKTLKSKKELIIKLLNQLDKELCVNTYTCLTKLLTTYEVYKLNKKDQKRIIDLGKRILPLALNGKHNLTYERLEKLFCSFNLGEVYLSNKEIINLDKIVKDKEIPFKMTIHKEYNVGQKYKLLFLEKVFSSEAVTLELVIYKQTINYNSTILDSIGIGNTHSKKVLKNITKENLLKELNNNLVLLEELKQELEDWDGTV